MSCGKVCCWFFFLYFLYFFKNLKITIDAELDTRCLICLVPPKGKGWSGGSGPQRKELVHCEQCQPLDLQLWLSRSKSHLLPAELHVLAVHEGDVRMLLGWRCEFCGTHLYSITFLSSPPFTETGAKRSVLKPAWMKAECLKA